MALSDSIWWTRKAKIQAEKRILANAFQSQVILLWYSFAAVAASVFYLKFSVPGNDMSGIAWVVYSVLVLCISGFINGLSFKQRAGLIKECYETLNDIYHRIKRLESGEPDASSITELSTEYEKILGVCENHLTIDYYMALCETQLTESKKRKEATDKATSVLDKEPTPFIWFVVGFSLVKRWLMLGLFYVLPIALFFVLEN